ncbi:condensation domain-containing protein [Mucilaginibacter sp. P25]|uniref:condensation domain-containing protein n=1 Tax=Mucilaginibacter sp. P25 TaxID=3423945 RepID=UPI003D78DCCE
MEIHKFIKSLNQLGFVLIVKNDKLVLKGNKKQLGNEYVNSIKENDEIINYIKSHKQELIDYISSGNGNAVADLSGDITSVYRLSGLQEGMLFHGLYNGELSGYVEQFICDLLDLDVALFEASWDYLFRRHSILRSSFHYDELQIPVQCVHREVRLPLTLLDYREKPVSEHEDLLESYRRRDYEQGIDFKSAPLMRISLIRLSEERYRMIWTHHHILTDGWSISILIGELLKSYDQLLSGQELPEVREDRYEDYIRYLEGIDSASAETYWRGYVSGLEGGTLLPFISRGSQERNRGGLYKRKELLLDASTSRQIERYTQGHRITVNTLMQGVWSYLLHRYTGNPHISYGVTVSGRPDDLGGIEERVGMYINTIPLHSVLEEDKGIAEWLQGIQSGQLQSLEYQYTPLSSIQKWSGIAGDMFDSLLVFENYPVSSVVGSSGSGLRVEGLKTEEHSNYLLNISVVSSAEIRVTFDYNTELLPDSDMENIRGHFEKVLQEIVSGEKLTVGTLEMLSAPELGMIVEEFNSTATVYPSDVTVVDLFESQVLLSGSSVAVVYEGESLSYSELDARSNALGHYLRSRGVREDTLVGICIDRSLEMIVGLLGILKAGGAYVPIDPDYPQDRIAYMLEDTGSRLLLSSSRVSAGLSMVTEAEVVELDRDWAKIASYGSLPVERSLQPTHLAYVIYTSGSTGTPKGVMVEHRSIVRLVRNTNYISITKEDRILSLSNFVFDGYTFDIYGALLNGASIVIPDKIVFLDLSMLNNIIIKNNVTILL